MKADLRVGFLFMKAFCQSIFQWQPISLSCTVRDKEYWSAIACLAITCPGENRILHFFHQSIDRTWARACNMHSPGRALFTACKEVLWLRQKNTTRVASAYRSASAVNQTIRNKLFIWQN